MRGGTIIIFIIGFASNNFNPPAPCGAGPALRTFDERTTANFNPPAPCGAGQSLFSWIAAQELFQSTRPVRGGTKPGRLAAPAQQAFQSTRPMRGGTSSKLDAILDQIFQSTRPMRGGTMMANQYISANDISIHPPHAGRDG